jgi:hypothetical protein
VSTFGSATDERKEYGMKAEYCDRCKRELPPIESDGYSLEVEAIERPDGSIGVICDACVTLGERQAIHEEMMDMAENTEGER